jgi:two-component system cell cycle response regulator DivK
VDDDRSTRASAVRLLTARGYRALEATSEAEAVQKAASLAPDVILMDLHLRHGSGLDAARRIKEQPTLARIPIVALTATPPTWDEKMQLFAAVLTKPCPTPQILEAIEAVLRP